MTDDLVKIAEEKLGVAKVEIKRAPGLEKFRETTKDQFQQIPYLKLIQAMSDDVSIDSVTPGVFRNSLTGEVVGSKVEFIPISLMHQRIYFLGREVECRSFDSLVGDKYGECAKCQYNKWHIAQEDGTLIERPNQNTRLKKHESWVHPECSDTYIFPSMILTGDLKAPGALVFRGKSLKEGYKLSYLMETLPNERHVFFAYVTTMSNDKGKWFSPKITVVPREITEEEAIKLNAFRTRFEEQAPEVVLEDETEEA